MSAPWLSRPGALRVAAPLVLGAVLIALWQVLCKSLKVPVYLVPAPSDVAHAMTAEWPSLWRALMFTMRITLIALLVSVVVGVGFAFLMVQSRALEASLLPYAILLQVTPIVAIAPLIIIWVKDPTAALVLCAVMVAIFPIISNTVLGLRSASPGLRNLFRIHHASRWQTLVRLRIPAALPYFFAGLRISSGLALIGAVVAEFVAGSGGANAGLAYQILQAGLQLNIPLMFAALVLIALAGLVLFGATVLTTRWVMHRWYDAEAI